MKNDFQSGKPYKTPLKKAIVMYIIVSIFLFFEMAVQVSPSVMASSLMRDLHIGTFALGLMSGFYFYTYTGMQIPSGILFDRFKPKNLIIISLTVCSLGAITFGLINNYYFGCLARLLMGFGSAFAFISVLVVASDLFPKKYFALLTGITQMLAAVGAMSGQLPISFVVHAIGWHLTMILLGIFGLLLAAAVWMLLNYQKSIKELSKINWLSDIKSDLKTILGQSQTWFIALYACLLWAPMSGFASLWGVPFLVHFNNISTNEAALLSSMMWLGLAVGSPLLGLLTNVLNNKIISLWLSALVGGVFFTLIIEFKLPAWILGVGLFMTGAACSGQALSFVIVRNNNSKKVKATAIAFNNMAVVISGAIFQPMIGKLIEFYQQHGYPNYYQMGCYVILFAYIIALLLSIFFIRENPFLVLKRKNYRKFSVN